MRTGKLNQSSSGLLNAGTWQLVEEKLVTETLIEQLTYPSYGHLNTSNIGFSQGFKVSSATNITKITVKLRATASPTGTLTMYVYSDNAGKPNSVLATFSTKDASTITGTAANYEFTGNYVPTVGVQYHFVLVWTSIGGSGYIEVSLNDTNPYADGAWNWYDSGLNWTGISVYDAYFIIYQNALTSYTFSGLNGDVDQEYRIIARVITGSGGGGNEYIRCNNDSSANYGAQRLTGANTTVSANRDTDFTGLFFINGNSSGDSNFGDIIIKAKSGYVRTAIANSTNRIAGTTVTQIVKVGSAWNNTADNITSLTIVSGVSGGLGVGTHLFLFKRNLLGVDATSGIKTGDLNVQGSLNCGLMQKIYQTTLTEAATSVTISGLDGNTDIIYELLVRQIGGSESANFGTVTINADGGAYHYGYQILSGAATTASASRGTDSKEYFNAFTATASGSVSFCRQLIYAKSGNIRVMLSDETGNISTTTVASQSLSGYAWNNTADNITSLVLATNQTNGLGIGTHIELWALRKRV